MLFLKWWNPTTWLSDVNGSIVGGVIKALRSVFYSIATMIYKLIINLYNLFEVMCHGRLLDSDAMRELSSRIGLILGIVMFFYVTFSFVQLLIDPDLVADKTRGASNIIKKCILVIVMLGIFPILFNTLYRVQSMVINNHVISKLLLPYRVDTTKFGNALSAELFVTFYDVQEGLKDDVDDYVDLGICQQEVYTLKDRIYESADFSLGYSCLNESMLIVGADGSDVEVTIINFDWILSIAVGLAIIWFLLMYCIGVGMRMIQLALLEIISPMAIISHLSPKQETMFNKWSKLYFATYIDVFIRIAIINFIVFLISTILDNKGNWTFWKSIGNPQSNLVVGFVSVAMIVSLLAFAKKAPELIKELFPASASRLGLGISSPKNFLGTLAGGAAIGKLGKRAYGAAQVGLGVAGANLRRSMGKLASIPGLSSNEKDILKQGRMQLKSTYSDAQFDAIDNQIEKLYAKDNFTSADKLAVDNLQQKLFKMRNHNESVKDYNDNARAHNALYNAAYAKKEANNRQRNMWLGRSVTGTAKGLVSGGMRGLTTTDKSGRAGATKVGAARQSSNWKLKDAGYDIGDKVTDMMKNAFDIDTNLGQRAKISDYELESLSRRIAEVEKASFNNGEDIRNIIKENGNYYIYDTDGRVEVTDLSTNERQIADLNSELGKARSANKALHQRENEKK